MTWVTIPDGDIDPDSPITTGLMTALRDNPQAIANGDSGAPIVKPRYMKLSDVKTTGTAAGGFTSGAWQTRVLNTIDSDIGSDVSLSSNQFTLVAGTYIISARSPAHVVDAHKCKLRNISDSTDELIGSSSNAIASTASTDSFVVGEFTIASSKIFELQHRCFSTKTVDGFGVASSGFGVSEVYAVVELWRIA